MLDRRKVDKKSRQSFNFLILLIISDKIDNIFLWHDLGSFLFISFFFSFLLFSFSFNVIYNVVQQSRENIVLFFLYMIKQQTNMSFSYFYSIGICNQILS